MKKVRKVIIGLYLEGSTDERFLGQIVDKTAKAILTNCNYTVDIETKIIRIEKTGLKFVEQVLKAAKKGWEAYGIDMLCVHKDADRSLEDAQNSMQKAKNTLRKEDKNTYCTLLVAIIPAKMTESWMLADKELLKEELNTKLSDQDLKIDKRPESMSDPKQVIKDAIDTVNQSTGRKRRRRALDISDLYQMMGATITLEKLHQFPSYLAFKEELILAFEELNIHILPTN